MKNLIVRTGNGVLRRALDVWFSDHGKDLPEGEWILSDLDTVDALGVPGEITCGHAPGAELSLPLLWSRLGQTLRDRPSPAPGRLLCLDGDLYLDGERLALTPAEKKILLILLENDGPVSAKRISELLGEGSSRSNKITVHISSLRKKTEPPGKAPLIRTVHRKGYRLENK